MKIFSPRETEKVIPFINTLINTLKTKGKIEKILTQDGANGKGVEGTDVTEFIKQLNLEDQYDERLNTLKYFKFLTEKGEVREGDAALPSCEKAMNTFTLEELKIASGYKKPTLLLIPEISFEAKIKAINAKKQPNEVIPDKVVYYSDSDDSDGWRSVIKGWRAVIVDGSKEMEVYDGDDIYKRFDIRIQMRKATRKPSEKGMDRHRYAMLKMEAIKDNKPINQNTTTILDDDPALDADGVLKLGFDEFSGFRVPDASWRGFHQNWCNSTCTDISEWGILLHRNQRFRSSVGGNVLFT